MTHRPNQLRNAAKQRLLAGLPVEQSDLGYWQERPYSIQQLSALLDTEIDLARSEHGSLMVFRVRHRPFGIVEDEFGTFTHLRPELLAALHRAHSGIKAIGSARGEIVGFAPRLRRQSDGAELLAELVRVLSEPVQIDGLSNLIAPRIGSAVLDDDNLTSDALLSAAKLAVQEATASNSGAMFHTSQRHRRLHQRVMAETLHKAVVARSLSTRYQPDVDLATGAIVAIKAYAHWSADDGRVISNQELFQTARTANLLVPIGRQVIEEALRATYSWITTGLVSQATLWVNVHPDEVLAPDFEAAMTKVIRFDERLRLGLELTENPIVDQAHIYEVLRRLRSAGAAIALGGFGTGYLNLAAAQEFPFTAAKIDRTLTRQIVSNTASAKLVRAVANLAELFGLEVTAHGIETVEQVRRLQEIGCTIGQGFHYARPMTADDMRETLIQVRMGRTPF
jgi:EAL domain-containing protein (putative c-di-GMP-specific phosphodiesterase class I)